MADKLILPKLYSPVWIRFWSLRDKLGPNMGVMFDCDAQVERRVIRVLTDDGWKWQIVNITKLIDGGCDFYAEQDQEILNEHGSDVEFKYIAPPKENRYG